MREQGVKYTRLPIKGMSAVLVRITGRLYLADDHLLYIEQRNYTERARRFYFRDIQMISYAETNAWLIVGGLLGLLALVAFFFAITLSLNLARDAGERDLAVVLALCMALPGLLLLAASLRRFLGGPSCKCSIHTAVQETELIAVRKVRQARRLVELLRPPIEAAQSEIAGAVPQAVPDAPVEVVAPSSYAQVRMAPAGAAIREKGPFNARFHVAAFIMGLVMGVSWLVDFFYRSDTKDTLDMVMFFASIIVFFVALIVQHRTRSPRDLRWMTWLTACTLFGYFTWGLFFGMFLAFEDPSVMQTGTIETDELFEIPAFQAMVILASTLTIVFSVIGLMRLARGTRSRNAPTAFSPASGEEAPRTSGPEAPHE